MKLRIYSDLHITDEKDELYEPFLESMRSFGRSGNHIVLAGDIFDMLWGDKPEFYYSRFQRFFECLSLLAAKAVKIDYIEGNHDFLLKKTLPPHPNIHHSESEVILSLSGKRFFIAHGDLIDQSDIGYLLLRRFWRCAPMRLLGTVVPGKFIQWVGETSSSLSQARKKSYGQDLSGRVAPEKLVTVRQIFHDYAQKRFQDGFDFVVMGHCHDLDGWNTVFNDRPCQYINMGYPRVHGQILEWSANNPIIKRIPLAR